MRRFLLTLWLLSMAFLTGCERPIEFAEPISPPGDVEFDTRLVGVWIIGAPPPPKSSPDSAPPMPVYRDIVAINVWPHSNRPHVLRVELILIPESVDKRISWFSGSLHPSAIDGRIYYSFHQDPLVYENLAGMDDRAAGYLILRLDLVDDDSLLVQGMRYDAIQSLIAERDLAREEIPRGSDLSQIILEQHRSTHWLSQGGEQLAALLRDTPDDRLFVLLATAHRLDSNRSGYLNKQGYDSWFPD